MTNDSPTILALDFDGVICDGMLEYFQTSWRTYCQIWKPENQTPPNELAPSFYRLRPVVEVGWEMPVLLRALLLGISEEKILEDWSTVASQVISSENLDAADIGKKLDAIRDEWMKTDLDDWLSLHCFYPGVIERLNQIISDSKSLTATTPTELFIVTTKESRFVQQLLLKQAIQLPENRIIGKECKRPKHQTLRQLIEAMTSENVSLWFVEDRLKTLQSVQEQTDLTNVRLYLADWGYNTKSQQESVLNHPRIQLLSLATFVDDFSSW
jgi:phosphoglycolate phosphatase-like HAD superfamily hydrolase